VLHQFQLKKYLKLPIQDWVRTQLAQLATIPRKNQLKLDIEYQISHLVKYQGRYLNQTRLEKTIYLARKIQDQGNMILEIT